MVQFLQSFLPNIAKKLILILLLDQREECRRGMGVNKKGKIGSFLFVGALLLQAFRG